MATIAEAYDRGFANGFDQSLAPYEWEIVLHALSSTGTIVAEQRGDQAAEKYDDVFAKISEAGVAQ